MDREQRAKQFLPFSALKGYEEALREREKIRVPRPQLFEESAKELDGRLRKLEKGDEIDVIFYRQGEYHHVRGRVTRLNRPLRFLEVNERKIWFDDLYKLKFLDELEGF